MADGDAPAPTGDLRAFLDSQRGTDLAIAAPFYDDLPFGSPHFSALQWLGARGLNPSYKATPDLKLTCRRGLVKLSRILAAEGKSRDPPRHDPQGRLRGSDICLWLRQADYQLPNEARHGALQDQPLDLADFSELAYQALAPR